MQTVRTRPHQAGRPTWVSAADWLLITERAREIAAERQANRRALARNHPVPLPARKELDFAWERDNANFTFNAEFSMGGPQPKQPPPPQRKEGMDRQADCNVCGHQFRSYALSPNCSKCNSKAVRLGPWEPRKIKGKRRATCLKPNCGYTWLTTSWSRPSCSRCHGKKLDLGPWISA